MERLVKDSPELKKITDRALAAIVDSSQDAIYATTLDGTILSWNRGAENIYGYRAEEIIGKNISILTSSDQLNDIKQCLSRLSRGQHVDSFETVRKRKDGTDIHVSLALSSIRDEKGEIVGVSTIARDITDRTRFLHTRSFLAAIVDSSDDAILTKDLDGYILSWNQGAERLYGYTEQSVIGKHVSILFPPELPDETTEILTRLRKGERIEHYETVRIAKDGRRLDVSVTISPVRDASGKIIAASAVARDITSQKRDEKEKAQLLADVKRSLNEKSLLLQEVYHRVKNNLQVVSSLLDLGAKYVTNDPDRAISTFQDSIERIRAMALVHEKLYKTGDFENLNFAAYLQSLIEQLFRTYSFNKSIEFKIQGDTPSFDLNTAIPLGLIFNELVTNSLKYAFTNSGGCITIDCRIEKDHVRLIYSDNGNGLPEGMEFATTETFGFRIVRLLTMQMKGTIHHLKGRGTVFEITIPQETRG